MKNIKYFGEEDRVLRMAVTMAAVLFMIAASVVAVRMTNLRVDASEGEKKLEELAKADVQEIDAKIQELEKEERQSSEEWLSRSNDEKFANSMILGDSISQGLYGYEHLSASLVNAEKGVGVVAPDETGLTDMIGQIIAANPQKVFIALGMNDVVAARGDAKVFVQAYKEVVEKLKEGLPNAEIYANSVLPASPVAIGNDERYANIPEYNEELAGMCEKEEITFIDNTELVKDEYYESDGIHMTSAYYPEWLNQMAEAADL